MAVTENSQQTNQLMITFQNLTEVVSDNTMEVLGLKSQALGFEPNPGLGDQVLDLESYVLSKFKCCQ